MLIDQRGRSYVVVLQPGGTYHTHSGALRHDLLLGQPEGVRLETASGMVLTAFRPRFADYALKMKRPGVAMSTRGRGSSRPGRARVR